MAAKNTLDRLRRHAYFPHMNREVNDFVASCQPCQAKAPKLPPQRHTLLSPQDGHPFQVLSIDFVGPLRESRQGNTFIFTVKDNFTRWIEAFPIKHATAKIAVTLLEKEIFARYGIPEVIRSDNGSQFLSRLYKDMGTTLGYKISYTTPYNPKANTVERAHKDLGAILRATVSDDASTWEEALPQALFAMRTSISLTTGFAPFFFLLF